MEFLAVAVDKLWKYTVVPVARQVGYVIFYHSNVNELKMEVEELQRARERLQHKIDAAERNGERIEGDVLNWLTQVDEMKMKTDDLNNVERHANTTCSGRSIPNLLLRHKLSRGSKKMKEEIVKIKAKGSFDSVSYRGPNLIRASSLTTHGEKFGSRVSVLDDITKELQDPNVQTIGLYGPAGVGKTTLVEEVANKSQQQNLFDVVVLAYVRQNPKMEEIQSQIAYKLGLELKEINSSVRANELHNRLMMKEEKVLVIFDDLWEELKLHEIGIPSIKQHKGLKILMTSRNRELLSNRMNTHKNFCLPVLTKDEGWKLFIDKAQFDESSANEELKSIATKIVEKCGGLPVAIVTIASSLKKKSSSAWNDALRRLQNPSPTDITTTEADLYKFIEVSYENLDNYLYRSVFLLLGEMTSISSINDLFKISVGLGLFENIYNMEKARDSFHTCISKLKDTCLLQDSDSEDRFVMHDVVQAAAIFLASRNGYLFRKIYGELQEWPGKDQLQNCRTMIIHESKIVELPEGLNCPNLAFFHLDRGISELKVPDNFFKGICGLKVLTLVGRRLTSLPLSFSLLSNLRTLRLELYSDSPFSGDIAIIGEFEGLKVLTLLLNIRQLPQKLGQLTQLQLLDLRGCSRLQMIPPNVLSSFRKLVELYLPGYIQWYIDHPNNPRCNASLVELNDLTRLTTLEICILDQRMLPKDLVLQRLQRYNIIIRGFHTMIRTTSRKLELNLGTSIHLWENVKRLLDNVEILVLGDLKGAKNVVPEINVEGMPQLKELSLSSSDEIQTIIESSGLNHANAINIFSNLEELRIKWMTNLTRLWDGPLAGKSFSRLKHMSVYSCPKMKILFSAFTVTEEIVLDNDKVLNFPQLRFLSLEYLPELISFCNEDETYSSAQSTQFSSDMGDNNSFTHTALFDDKVIFPSLEEMTIRGAFKLNTIWHCQRRLRPNSFDKLKMLEIENCSKLKILFPSHVSNEFQSLETLIIRKCERLGYLFPASVVKNLCKLQKLEVKKCDMMEDIIMKDDSTSPSSSDEVIFPSLEEMTISGAFKLNTTWHCQRRLRPNSFDKLKKLKIEKCSKLKILFPSHVSNEFQSLETLILKDCESLRYLFPASVAKNLCKLQKLEVEKCDMMEDIIMKDDSTNPSSSDEVLFPNLEELIITKMDKLNRICSWNQLLFPNSFGRLREVYIRNCPKFISILPCYKINTSQSLQKLTIIDCKSLEQIFDLQGEKQATEVSGFPNLEVMQVEGCERLKYLFPAFVATSLGKIRQLTIGKCLNMEEIIMVEDSSNHSFNKEVVFPNLEEMIICDMDKLNTIWGMQQRLAPNSFGRLYSITIRNCPRLISIFPCYVISMIQSLKYIIVEGCGGLKHLLPVSVAKKLEALTIKRCPMMEVLITDDNSNQSSIDEILFPNLEEFIILDMDKLNTICHWLDLVSATSFGKLRTLEISSCPKFIFPGRIKIQSLEKLRITNCKYLEQISGDTLVAILLSNPKLMELCVGGYHCQPFLFSSSLAKGLDNLRLLTIEECSMMEGIIRFEDDIDPPFGKTVLFPNLEEMRITNMDKLNKIWCWQHKLAPNSFGRLRKIEIRNCPELVSTFPCDIISTTHSFEQLIVIDCKSLEQIFDPRGVNARETDGDTNGLPVERESWWFQEINVKGCECLKYLFPLSVAKSFRNIRRLEIEKCSKMEEIIKVEDNIHPSFSNEVVFPNLWMMTICDMDKLNTLWGMQQRLAPNSFGRLYSITIRDCPGLISIFPCYVISMIQSLKYITVEGCGGLKHLLPATVAKELRKLVGLRIERCSMMEVLITDDNSNQSSIDEVLFPNLEEMTITNMNKLKRIWCWQQQLAPNSFGRLGEIKIINCPELVSTFPCDIISTTQSLKKLSIIDCKSVEQIFDLQGEKQATEVSGFPNLEEMQVKGCERLKYLFPAFVATSLGELRMLTVGKCLNMEEIIMVEDDSHHSLNKEVVFPNLETMIICDMDKLNTIWGMQQRLAPNSFGRLYSITIRNCPGLISIFPCYVISMIQSLKYITVEGCGWLKHLLPATVAKELRKLERLRIESCSMMEVLITDDYTNEFSIDEILFPNLEELIIIDMDKLNTLCHWFHLLPPTSFRKLRTLEIGNCPEFIFRSHLQSLEELRITNCKYLEQISGETLVAASILLSYPKLMELCVAGCHCLPFLFSSSSAKSLDNLRVLRLKECFVMEEIIRFEGDIDPLFGKKVVFPNLEKMSITGMPKLNTIWGLLQQLPPSSFGRLNKIEIENCEGFSKGVPLSLLKSLNNLQELQLKSCNSLREVFDLEEETDIHEDQTPRASKSSLKILILDSLPNLKQLWNKDPRGILDFQSLLRIYVSKCESVKYLFPVSVAKSLMQLQQLKIESCVGLEHIVAGERGTDTSISFVFPRVDNLDLWDLPKLKGFYPGRFKTEWPSLPNEWLTTNVDGGPSFSEFEDRIVWSG